MYNFGDFYGNTEIGGAYQAGTIFKITASDTLTTLYSFCAETQ
ncbi:MAG TPA: choice-of-anchor tandem repeat GloVer-containing protein [Bryobacteraceae bacterium]|nr:choice-of-anchor tandem repeat GloVer-containing protein [Bryobacteraceae bacterium]